MVKGRYIEGIENIYEGTVEVVDVVNDIVLTSFIIEFSP